MIKSNHFTASVWDKVIPTKRLNRLWCIWGADLGGNEKLCISWGSYHPRGNGNFNGHFTPHWKVAWRQYRGYPTCGRYFQLYILGGSSSAAFRCQYCSNLFINDSIKNQPILIILSYIILKKIWRKCLQNHSSHLKNVTAQPCEIHGPVINTK